MKKLTVLMLVVVFGLALATSASAGYLDPGTLDPLQGVLDGITVNPAGNSSVNVYTDYLKYDANWMISASGGSVSTMIIELAGLANTNTFGVYDTSDPTKKVQLFAGTDVAGKQAVLGIADDGRVLVNFSYTGVDFAGNSFGFYLSDSTTPITYYSNDLLNKDGLDHMLAYRGNDSDVVKLPGLSPGIWSTSEYILGFEDVLGGGDFDYDDMVVMVESVAPVPEPATLLLLGAGLAGLGYFGRRKRNG